MEDHRCASLTENNMKNVYIPASYNYLRKHVTLLTKAVAFFDFQVTDLKSFSIMQSQVQITSIAVTYVVLFFNFSSDFPVYLTVYSSLVQRNVKKFVRPTVFSLAN